MAFKSLKYPSDLKDLQSTIRFSCRDGQLLATAIDLPIPTGVKFSDGGIYDQTNLGVGAVDADKMAAGATAAFDALARQGLNATGMVRGLSSIAASSIANKAISATGDFGKDVQFYGKKIVPPNTNTTFTGNSIRSFTFDFTMVARTEEDTYNIREIHQTLRRYIYAGASEGLNAKLVVSYPPVWTIEFFIDGKESIYYPKIYSCYMETVDCSIGNLSIAKMANGAPIDVNLSVSFKETRALNRLDIDELEGKGNRGIDPATGLAKAQ